MSKVYILYKEELTSGYDKVDIVAVFSSYSAMLLWLKESWDFVADVEDKDKLGAYFSEYYTDQEVTYFLSYSVKDLIGEHCPRTGCLKLD